jgi:hypothetical protein
MELCSLRDIGGKRWIAVEIGLRIKRISKNWIRDIVILNLDKEKKKKKKSKVKEMNEQQLHMINPYSNELRPEQRSSYTFLSSWC